MAFQITVLPPSPDLAEHVLFYIARRRSPGATPPAPWTTHFPANMYSALTIVHRGLLCDEHTAQRGPGAMLSGTMSEMVAREYHDWPETTVVVFKPGRLTDFCRLPASDLTDCWADSSAVFTLAEEMEIGDRMASQPTVARQVLVLEQLLRRRFAARLHTAARPLARALRSLVWRLPHMRVAELAEELGWGVRRLERRFQATFGVGPKMMIRLARLQFALAHLQLGSRGEVPLASIAQATGFSDQAHLSRELKSLAGFAPTVLRAVFRCPGNSAWAFAVPQDSLAPLAPQA